MRIVSWNCNGALRKKLDQLLKLDADIYVVQECEDPSQSKDEHYRAWAENYLWIGNSKHRGLGVFCKKEISLSQLDWESDGLKYLLPCQINNNLTLLSVWTQNQEEYSYIGQLWKYLHKHKGKFSVSQNIICGDFNSNTCWDDQHRGSSHSDVVKELGQIGIESLYHKQTGEQQGKELQKTFYLYRKTDRDYHIDYVFLSSDLIPLSAMSIGKSDEWLEFSDHMPVVFTIGNKGI
jgi:exonuclease III